MPAIVTNLGGSASAPADVCKTPTPAGTVPTPYPNIGMNAQGDTGTLTQKVKVVNGKVFTKNSKISMSSGDEAGSAGGVVSGKIKGSVSYTSSCLKVRCEGALAIVQGNVTGHNGDSANTVGVQESTAQFKVNAQ